MLRHRFYQTCPLLVPPKHAVAGTQMVLHSSKPSVITIFFTVNIFLSLACTGRIKCPFLLAASTNTDGWQHCWQPLIWPFPIISKTKKKFKICYYMHFKRSIQRMLYAGNCIGNLPMLCALRQKRKSFQLLCVLNHTCISCLYLHIFLFSVRNYILLL